MTTHTGLGNVKDETIKSRQRSSKLRQYFCPHCQTLLMKGNIKRLKMSCPNCQKMIDSTEKELLKS